MAAPDHIALTQTSFAQEHVVLGTVQTQQRKDQKKELAQIATELKALTGLLEEAKSGASDSDQTVSTEETSSSSAPSGNTQQNPLEEAITKMVAVLQSLQVKIVEYGQDKANQDVTISESQVQMANDQLHKTLKDIKKIEHKQHVGEILGIVSKVVEGVVALGSAVLAIALAQPELLVVTALSLAAMTGVTSKATEGVSDLLQDCGMSKEVANIVAGVVVTVAVVALTILVAPEDAAAQVADEVGDVSSAADGAASGASGASEETSTLQQAQEMLSNGWSKARSVMKTVNLFNRLSTRANLAIMALVQTVSQTQLVTNTVKAIPGGKNKKLDEALNIILTIATAIVTIATADAAIGGAAESGGGWSNASQIGRLMNKATESSTLMRMSWAVQQGGNLGQEGSEIYQGVNTIQQGELEGALGNVQADQQLLHAAMDQNSTETTADQKAQASAIQRQNTSDRGITQLLKGEQAFARLLTSYSPV